MVELVALVVYWEEMQVEVEVEVETQFQQLYYHSKAELKEALVLEEGEMKVFQCQ